MRGLAYVIAAIAAVGIMIGIASVQNDGDAASTGTNAATTADGVAATAVSTYEVTTDEGEIAFDVPSMHCEFACFPRVKELIEGTDGVESVELAQQKEEGVLDNRQVIVKYQPGFDVNNALAVLAEGGYDDSGVAE